MTNPKLFEWVAGPPGQHPQHFDTEITLRDLFAAAALAGNLSNAEIGGPNATDAEQAKWAYHAADAMLAAREAKS